MSGLLGDLLNASKALGAQSKGVELAGRNIANSTNPSYARQRVVLGDVGTVKTELGAQSLGVQALGVKSLRDGILDSQVTQEGSVTSALQTKSDTLTQAQAYLNQNVGGASNASSIDGDSASGGGISGALSDFFNGVSALAANPSNTAQKQVLLQKAGALADQINSADAGLATVQQSATARVTQDTSDANDLLANIANLNQQIGRFEAGGQNGSAVDLRDQRQAAIEQLAQKMNIEVKDSPDASGQVQILARDNSGAAVTLVDKATQTAKLGFDGANVTAGTPPVALNVTGGSIAGSLQARDGAVADLRNGLKALAGQLTSAVNSAYNSGGGGGNFFAASPAGGKLLAVDPALTAATLKAGTAGAGSNDLAQAMAAVGGQTFSKSGGAAIDGTLGGSYTGLVTNLGQQLSSTSNQLDDQNLVAQQLSNQRSSVSGVSTDEEVVDLMKYQRAFEASSRVVSVIDGMLDEVINRMAA